MLVAEPAARLLFQHGQVPAHHAVLIAQSTAVYAGAIWAFGLLQIINRAYYAVHDTFTPLVMSSVNIVINLAVEIPLLWKMGESGMAVGTVASFAVQALMMLWMLDRRLGGLSLRPVLISAAKMLFAALLMAAACVALKHSPVYPHGQGRIIWARATGHADDAGRRRVLRRVPGVGRHGVSATAGPADYNAGMKYRTLGKTGLEVSLVGVGTWQYGGEWGKNFTQEEVDAIFDQARNLGVNLIDTAECYGDHTSEAFIGNAVQRDRTNWIIATKFGHKFHAPFNRTDQRSAADLHEQVEASLAALKTDYLDLLQYHSVRDEEFTDPAVRDEMAALVKAGKVRFIGNSIGNAAIKEDGSCVQAGKSEPFNISVLQVVYNRLDRRPEKGHPSVFDIAIQQNLGVLARVPLASGLLSGKYKPGATFAEGDVRTKWKDPNLQQKLQTVAEIQRTEVPKGVEMAAWALAWCLKNPAVTSVIPGCKSAEQLAQNAAAAELV